MRLMAIMEFVQRFQELQIRRDSSDDLIKDLLIYCERMESGLRQENQRLAQELQDAQLDLDDAKRSRRDLQQQLTTANTQLGQSSTEHENLKNRNPYIAVLLDGDGLIFQENLIRQGIDGGKKAANLLRSAVLKQYTDLNEDVEVVAKVCANISGLAAAMKRDGSIDTMQELKDFSLGFTQGKASFDFIDVGYGKERADSKIKESIRWNLRNHNCRVILLGVSHDAGYAPFLDEILQDESTMRRVTILEGVPAVRELANIGVDVTSFNELFRTNKLVDRSNSIFNTSNTSDSSPVSPSTTPTSTIASSYANASMTAGAAPAPTLKLPLAVKSPNPQSKSQNMWKPGRRGLDDPINTNAVALTKVRTRAGKSKLCNNHYLRGPCSKGEDCMFEHNYKVTEEELKAVAYLSRLNPCMNGQACEQEDCIYGHHCPSTVQGVCAQFNCRYPKDDHPPNTVIKHPRKGADPTFQYALTF